MYRFSMMLWLFVVVGQFLVAQALAQDAGAPDVGLMDVGESETSQIEAKVSAIFGEIDGLKALSFVERHGVLTLSGEVESAKLREDAEEIAGRVEGVVYVQNRITLRETPVVVEVVEKTTGDEAIQTQLNAIFAAVPALNNVRARVEAGVVHLEGETLDVAAVSKAEELARSQQGVAYVDNRITESVDVGERLSPAWAKIKDVTRNVVQRLPLFGLGVLVLAMFWILAGWVSTRVPLSRFSDTPLARDFVRQLIRWVIVIGGLFITLEVLSVTSLVTALLGTAGIAGIGIGFAIKDIVENYLAGFLLGMKQPFRQNDLVQIDGYEGKVVRLTSRETLLMTLDGNHLSLPNSLVFKGVLYNFSRNPLRRFDFVVGVHPGEDFKEVIRIGLEALASTTGVRADPAPSVTLDEFGDWTINVHFWGWVDQREVGIFAVKSEAIRRVNKAFLAADIDMPEPMQRVTNLGSVFRAKPELNGLPDTTPAVDLSPADPVDAQIEDELQGDDETNLLNK